MSALYNTAYWPVLTDALDALMSGNYTLFTENSAKLSSSYDSVGARSDAQLQIRCGDKIARVDTLDEFLPIMDRQERGSKIFGDNQTTLEMMCAQWRLNAKERYAGDFAVKTRHPVMFIGNTADALGSLVSAKNMSVAFEGSRVLQVDGYGVSSPSASCETSTNIPAARFRRNIKVCGDGYGRLLCEWDVAQGGCVL